MSTPGISSRYRFCAGTAPGLVCMVRAGSYVEALALSGKDLTLFGESGAEATIITTNGAARVFDIGAGVTAGTVLSDLTFRDGYAIEGGGLRLGGGASPSIRRCRFISNQSLREDGSSFGGALFVSSGSSPVIEDCSFAENIADYLCCEVPGEGQGGAIFADTGAQLTVARSSFTRNGAQGFEGGPGRAICLLHDTAAVIEDCTFRENWAFAGGGICSLGDITVRRCVFDAGSCGLGAGIFCDGGEFLIASCVFYDNDVSPYPGEGTIHAGGNGEIVNNTIAFNQVSFGIGGIVIASTGVAVRNNIIALNDGAGLYCEQSPAPGLVTCNDVWGNSDGNYGGACPDLTGIAGNISFDPLFCDAPGRDLHIHRDSPCAPSAGACGLIGALGVGCPVAVNDEAPPPRALVLHPLRPNPIVLPATIAIAFELQAPAHVRLGIYDASGRRIAALAEGAFAAGQHEIPWSGRTPGGRDLSSGVYYVEIEAGGARQTGRLVLIR